MGLSIAPGRDVFSVRENLWNAICLARNVKKQSEKNAQDVAEGKPVTHHGYNEDSEDLGG